MPKTFNHAIPMTAAPVDFIDTIYLLPQAQSCGVFLTPKAAYIVKAEDYDEACRRIREVWLERTGN